MSQKSEDKIPLVLFHGSAFNDNELRPGFERSGVLVEWDETENNRYLYATTSKEDARLLGLASALEKRFLLDRFSYEDKTIKIVTPEKDLKTASILSLDVYLYTIKTNRDDDWVKNNNQSNHIDSEWKTDHSPIRFQNKEKVDVLKLLKTYNIHIQYVNQGGEKVKPSFTW